ncbi:hypothetical protein NECID01_1765 [Nematocida sp. AWRm77]|nr:hypothetical protein NECID01_1765 [Nematocida sp. AWRm77]
MSKDTKKAENALRKARVDFPAVLQEKFRPGSLVHEIVSSERKQEEFRDVCEMLAQGMAPLIQENAGLLKDSVVDYHSVHTLLQELRHAIEDAQKEMEHISACVEGNEVLEYLEDVKKKNEQEKKEQSKARTKEMLALDTLTVKDVYTGRLKHITENLKHVESESIREEIQKKTELGVWKIKKEIERKLAKSVCAGEDVTQEEVAAHRLVGGSLCSVLHEAVEQCLISAINKAASAMKKDVLGTERPTKKEEKNELSSVLAVFAKDVKDVLGRTHALLQKHKVRPAYSLLSAYRYSASLYAEIVLGEEEHAYCAAVSMPSPETRHTEETVLQLFADWSVRFFKRLIGETSHISEEESVGYDITSIRRTGESTKMYKDLFLSKYNILHTSAREDPSVSPGVVLNIHQTRSEECALVVHGVSLLLFAEIEAVYMDVLPDRVGGLQALQSMGVSACFERKKASLLSKIEAATVQVKEEHGSAVLEKYCMRVREVLELVEEFVDIYAEGLEKEFQSCLEEVMQKLRPSVHEAFRAVAKGPEGLPEEIKYLSRDAEELEREFMKWNNPRERSAVGESFLGEMSSQKFKSLSSFLGLSDGIWKTVCKISQVMKSKEDRAVWKSVSEEMGKDFSSMWGYSIAHLLGLSTLGFGQLVQTGDVADKKFHHFLFSDVLLVEKAAPVVQQYLCTYLFQHISSCMQVYKKDSFRHYISTLQGRLDRLLEKQKYETNYSLDGILCALQAIEKKDRVYIDALQNMFGQDSAVSQSIEEYTKALYDATVNASSATLEKQ